MTQSGSSFEPAPAGHTSGDYSADEVGLANRNCGTLLETLRHDITPAGAHYLLNHFDIPFVPSAADWLLKLDGLVDKPAVLRVDELQELPTTSRKVTLECAGNGRALLSPRWQSQPWRYEAVGTGAWTGTPLRGVLEAAGVQTGAVDIVFHGADRGADKGGIHRYSRSLSPARAMHPDVLLVWAMNDQPLLPQHGFPLRLIVPGWYGMASVKWLEHIEVIDRPFTGHQQVGTYVYKRDADDPGTPVTHMRVKSLLVPPGVPEWSTRTRLLEPGPVTVYGRAWSGDGTAIAKVEFGDNDDWAEATLEPVIDRYAWRGWRCDWRAESGRHTLRCRATDTNGNTQPMSPVWDRGGFGNNAVHEVEVWVS